MSENEGQGKAKLFAKMAKVMGELTTFGKDAKNSFQNYNYVSAAAVTERIGRSMANAGIAFFSSVIGMQTTEDKRYIVEYEYTFACSESGAIVSSRWFGEAVHTTKNGALDDKALNKAATTALKYFLLNTFVVSAAEDVDVDAGQNHGSSNSKKADTKKSTQGNSSNNGKTTRTLTAEEKAWKKQVMDLTVFLYEDADNESYNQFEHNASIDKRMEDTSNLGISPAKQTPDVAASVVLAYRATQDLHLTITEFPQALDGNSLKLFMAGYEDTETGLRQAWARLVDHADKAKPKASGQ